MFGGGYNIRRKLASPSYLATCSVMVSKPWQTIDAAGIPARSTEAVASDLLTFALAQRRAAGENLACWRSLTPREQQIAALACMNYTNRQIAAHLFISPETVKTHMRNVLRKFDLHSKAELRQTLGDWDFSSWAELVE